MDRGAPVVVALSPLVYSTAVARLLRDEGFEDVVVLDDDHRDERAASVAVVDGSRPPVDADVVLHLPGTGEAGEQVVVDLRGPQVPVVLEGPDALVAYVRRRLGTVVAE